MRPSLCEIMWYLITCCCLVWPQEEEAAAAAARQMKAQLLPGSTDMPVVPHKYVMHCTQH